MRTRQAVLAVLVVAAAVWLGIREAHFGAWMDDDAFISFRYAGNLAAGRGLRSTSMTSAAKWSFVM